MSSKNINQFNQYKYRTPLYTSNKSKQQKKKKYFNYPKNKSYIEETDVDSSPSRKENQSNNINSNKKVNSSILYEDEYQGLTYTPIYQDMSNTSIYYFIEWEKNDDFNNFKSKWKTEICRYWEMYGECKYGENCAFAHGDSELKQRKMTFNYKTKPCKQFFEFGYCSYGSRCQFSHKKEENLQKEKNIDDKENKVSYLKIIEELLSEAPTCPPCPQASACSRTPLPHSRRYRAAARPWEKAQGHICRRESEPPISLESRS